MGFLSPQIGGKNSPDRFDRKFDARANWWLIKQFFNNPYACVRAIFLDRSLIRKLSKIAANDPEWYRVHGFIKHVKGHKNHLHIRVGTGPGEPGCLGVMDSFDDEGEPEGEEDFSGAE